jgi:hypothetical protein
LGARDVLLEQLQVLARDTGDEDALLQCAVSTLPMDAAGLAHALADAPPAAADTKAAGRSLKRLANLSLVGALDGEAYWVHRWTSEALADTADSVAHRHRSARAGRYRLSRLEDGSGSLDDGYEATVNFLDAEQFDDASALAFRLAEWLSGAQQSLAAATFATTVLERVPPEASGWSRLADAEAKSQLARGNTARARQRY